MDTEFHYYINYLVTLRAGFATSDAYKISYASQYVDDNYRDIKVYNQQDELVYRNNITQVYLPDKTVDVLNNIYPVFHFIPSPQNSKSIRLDHQNHKLDVKPDSPYALEALRTSLRSNDLYWIGIASHAFVDSWAHQNFTGTKTNYNGFNGLLQWLIPDIGHADTIADPDFIGLVWRDKRLIQQKISNNSRFLMAALRLLEEYLIFFKISESIRIQIISQTRVELLQALGKETKNLLYNLLNYAPKRMKYYQKLSNHYNDFDIHQYSKHEWEKQALNKKFYNQYYWKNINRYKESDWYLFNQAVIKHHDFIWPLRR